MIGVVLAGDGPDGTNGLRAINAAGGIGVLQAPDEAVRADARNTLRGSRANDAHYCLPLDDIAELLRNLIDGKELEHE